MRPRQTHLIVAALIVATQALAEPAFRPGELEDLERWRKLPLETHGYVTPSADWHRVEHRVLSIKASLPCLPKTSRRESHGGTVIIHVCPFEGQRYLVMFMDPGGPATADNSNERGLATAYNYLMSGLSREARESGGELVETSTTRVSYHGSVGRQFIWTWGRKRVYGRLIPSSPTGFVSLQVLGESAAAESDINRFLNSLRFR